MVKENPNKESCKERMKELIRTKHLNRNRVVKRCMREFDGVHKSTFYSWYDEVINEPDIVSWEEDRKLQIVSEYQVIQDLKERMFVFLQYAKSFNKLSFLNYRSFNQ